MPTNLDIIELVKFKGHQHRNKPFMLSSGEVSNDYIDVTRAFSNGMDLEDLAYYIIKLLSPTEINTVGGPATGALPIVAVIASLTGWNWFYARDSLKRYGTENRIEGTVLTEHNKVLLIDDVVTTGKSLFHSYLEVISTGAEVVKTLAIVDRGGSRYDLPFFSSLVTYQDLNIQQVGD